MSANSGWAVDDVFEAHAELAVIVTVEVEEGEVSVFEVKAFQSIRMIDTRCTDI
jgi:hypothetical protein